MFKGQDKCISWLSNYSFIDVLSKVTPTQFTTRIQDKRCYYSLKFWLSDTFSIITFIPRVFFEWLAIKFYFPSHFLTYMRNIFWNNENQIHTTYTLGCFYAIDSKQTRQKRMNEYVFLRLLLLLVKHNTLDV